MTSRHCRVVVIFLGLLLALVPVHAAACLAASLQHYVFQAAKPAHIPYGLTSIEVNTSAFPSEGEAVVLPLTAAVNGLPAGTLVRIEPGRWTSCSNWGSRGQQVYAVGLFLQTKDGPVFAVVQLRAVINFRLDATMRAKLVTGMTDFGYSELVARASIMIAEANLDDYDNWSEFLDDVQRQADRLDPTVKVSKGK
ncbi:MAG: hypothetical protein JWO16_1696 [Sphingomonas bacterium]|nr:hypothetical protein [Sphingomonas bacterium]